MAEDTGSDLKVSFLLSSCYGIKNYSFSYQGGGEEAKHSYSAAASTAHDSYHQGKICLKVSEVVVTCQWQLTAVCVVLRPTQQEGNHACTGSQPFSWD